MANPKISGYKNTQQDHTTGTGESQVAMLNLSDQASVVKVTYDQTWYIKQRSGYRARKGRLASLPASQMDDTTTVG